MTNKKVNFGCLFGAPICVFTPNPTATTTPKAAATRTPPPPGHLLHQRTPKAAAAAEQSTNAPPSTVTKQSHNTFPAAKTLVYTTS